MFAPSPHALGEAAAKWSGTYARRSAPAEGQLCIAIDPVTLLIRGYTCHPEFDEIPCELMGVWQPPSAGLESFVRMANPQSESRNDDEENEDHVMRLCLHHEADERDCDESDKTATIIDVHRRWSAGRQWQGGWDGVMPTGLVPLCEASRAQIRERQHLALNPPPPTPVDPSRKVLRVTATNRKKPRVNTSTAAQHANVTSLALVFRMLQMRELMSASQTCRLWQAASMNPLAYLCTYTIEGEALVHFDGPQLGIQSPSPRCLATRIVQQYRAVTLRRATSLDALTNFQQVQLLTLYEMNQSDTVSFNEISPSVRFLNVKQPHSHTEHLLPEDFAQQIAHLNQLSELLVGNYDDKYMDARDLHQLWLAARTMPSLRRLILELPIKYEAFDEFRALCQHVADIHEDANEDARKASTVATADAVLSLTYVELPLLEDDPRRLTSVLDLMPHLATIQLWGTESSSWPLQVEDFPQWPQVTRQGLNDLIITEIDQPNAVCLLIAAAKLERLNAITLITRDEASLPMGFRVPLDTPSLTALCQALTTVEVMRLQVGEMDITSFDMFAAMSRLSMLGGITWPLAISRGNLAKAFPAMTRFDVRQDRLLRTMPYEMLATLPNIQTVSWASPYCMAPTVLREMARRELVARKENKHIVDDECALAMEDRKLAIAQAAYMCYTCSTEDGPTALVCEGCAAVCHAGHTIGPKETPDDSNPFVCACSVLGDEHQSCQLGVAVVDTSGFAPSASEVEKKIARYAALRTVAAEREQMRLDQEHEEETTKLESIAAAAAHAVNAPSRYLAAALELTSPTYLAYPPISEFTITPPCTISPPPIDILPTELLARVFSCLNLSELLNINHISSGWQRALADPLAIATDLEHPSIDRSKDENGRPRALARVTLNSVYGLHVHAPTLVVTSVRQLDLGMLSSSSPRSLFSRVHHFVLRPTFYTEDSDQTSAMLSAVQRLQHPIHSIHLAGPSASSAAWDSFNQSAVFSNLRFFHVQASIPDMHTIFGLVPKGVEHFQYTIAPSPSDSPFTDDEMEDQVFPLGLAALLQPLGSLHTLAVRTMSRMVLPPVCWTASRVDIHTDGLSRALDFLRELPLIAPQIKETHWLVPTNVDNLSHHAHVSFDSNDVVRASRVRELILETYSFGESVPFSLVFPELESLVVQSCHAVDSFPAIRWFPSVHMLDLKNVRRLEVQQLLSEAHDPSSQDIDCLFKAMPALTHLSMVNMRYSDLTSFAHLPHLRVLENFGWPALDPDESEIDLTPIFPSLEHLHVEFGSTSLPPAHIATALKRLPKLRVVKWMLNKEVSPAMLLSGAPTHVVVVASAPSDASSNSTAIADPLADFSIEAAFLALVLGAQEKN